MIVPAVFATVLGFVAIVFRKALTREALNSTVYRLTGAKTSQRFYETGFLLFGMLFLCGGIAVLIAKAL